MSSHIEISERLAADLCELIEALEIPVMTNAAEQLIAVAERCKESLSESDVVGALEKAVAIFNARRGRAPAHFLFSRDRAAEDAASKLKSVFPSWPYFVYHGTSSKALPSILEGGLVPHGGKSYWIGIVDEEYLSSGVFLTSAWRSAVTWAQATALTRAFQLRKDGSVPTIVRVKASSLELAPDVRSRSPNGLVHRGDIDVSEASCFAFAEPNGEAPKVIPVWLSIEDVIEAFPSKQQRSTFAAGSNRRFG